jgi:hypothetical protein
MIVFTESEIKRDGGGGVRGGGRGVVDKLIRREQLLGIESPPLSAIMDVSPIQSAQGEGGGEVR